MYLVHNAYTAVRIMCSISYVCMVKQGCLVNKLNTSTVTPAGQPLIYDYSYRSLLAHNYTQYGLFICIIDITHAA